MTRRPSRTAEPMLVALALAAAAALGRPASRLTPRTSRTEMMNVAPSTRNTGHTWPAPAAMSPVRPAPTTPMIIRVAWLSELAASRPASGTTRGTIATRAGEKKVPRTAWKQASANSAGSASARATRTIETTTTARSASDTSMIRRRSWRSA